MENIYPPLPKLWPRLSLTKNSRILVPLCGKSLDMKWLAEHGYRVTGVEVSPKALQEFMDHYPSEFSHNSSHGFTIYKSENIELWEGDFLNIPAGRFPVPDAIYDKAALVALPPRTRRNYAEKIGQLSDKETQILLQTFEYKQEEMAGPPFSVDENEIQRLYGNRFDITLLHEQSKFEELSKFQHRGLSSYLIEKVYLLESR